MRRQFFYTAVCSLSILFLQACSDSDGNNNPWQTPVTLKNSANISASKAASNNNGDLLIVWEEQETEERVNPSLATQFDVYQRTNIWVRTYDGATAGWQAEEKLQAGFLKKVATGEHYNDEQGVQQFRVTENIAAAFSTHPAMATNASGDAIAVWIQINESTVAGDAASNYAINTSHYTATTKAWSSVEKLTVNEALVLTDVNVSLAEDGTAQLLWLARDLTPDLTVNPKEKSVIKVYARSYVNSAWGAEQKLTEGSGSSSVQVTMFSATAGVAVWTQQNTNAKSIYQGAGTDPCIADSTLCDSTQLNLYGQWFDENGWQTQGTELLISNGLGEVGNFKLASNQANSVWLVWEQKADHLLKVTIKKQGFPDRVTYPREFSAASQTWVSQFDTTAHTWKAPAQLQTDDKNTTKDESKQHAIQPDIAIDSQGNAMAVWIQQIVYNIEENADKAFIGMWNNNVRQSVWVNTFSNNAWSGATLLDSDERFSNATPKVLATSVNNFTAAWLRWSSINQPYGYKLYSADYDASTSASSTAYEVNSSADMIRDFYLAKDKSNQVQIIWTGEQTALKYNVK